MVLENGIRVHADNGSWGDIYEIQESYPCNAPYFIYFFNCYLCNINVYVDEWDDIRFDGAWWAM